MNPPFSLTKPRTPRSGTHTAAMQAIVRAFAFGYSVPVVSPLKPAPEVDMLK